MPSFELKIGVMGKEESNSDGGRCFMWPGCCFGLDCTHPGGRGGVLSIGVFSVGVFSIGVFSIVVKAVSTVVLAVVISGAFVLIVVLALEVVWVGGDICDMDTSMVV